MLFDRQVILFDQKAPDAPTALSRLADRMHQAGVVDDRYRDAILTRESKFPTGLLTTTMGVAIPHTDADKVIEPQIGFMRLKEPVVFHQMGDNQEIEVRLIFMLALKKSADQLQMLQTLMELFQNQAAMDRLLRVTTADEVVEIMRENHVIS